MNHELTIEADPNLPALHIRRDFAASPALVMRAHLEPELFASWIGPDSVQITIKEWDARDGGSWWYIASRDGHEFGFRGCFHRISDDTVVQTFSWLASPEEVSLQTMRLEPIADGCRLWTRSLAESFDDRDAWLQGGMEAGVSQGYAKLDAVLAGM